MKLLIDSIEKIVEENKTGETLLEALIGFFTKDPVKFGEAIGKILRDTKSIPDAMFWLNFQEFLQAGKFDEEKLRKLATKLNEDANNVANATRIINSIKDVDEPQKAKYLAWLTEALINGQIEINEYFRLLKIVPRLISADLIYLSKIVEVGQIEINDDRIEDFMANGLLMNIEGGYGFTNRAYNLVEYGINYGHSVKRPNSILKRAAINSMQWEKI